MVVDHFTLPTSLLASLFNAKNGSNVSDTDDIAINKSVATDAPEPPATDAPEPPVVDENDNLSTSLQPVEQTPTDGNDDTDEDAAASSNGDIEVQVDNIKEVTPKNAQEYADSHTNRELKDRCKRLGLNASGKKLDLASRILSHNGSAEPIVILEG